MKKSNYKICLFLLPFYSSVLFSQTLPTPSIITSGPPNICPNQSLVLISSATYGNLWSNGDTTHFILVNTTGSYYVTQIVGTSTSAPSAAVNVSVYPFPSATLIPVGPICNNADPITLQGLPPGGYFSGSGVVGNMFDPSLANIGYNNLLHYETNQLFGTDMCADTSSIRITVSLCSGIKDISQNVVASIYPNPGSGPFTIDSPLEKIENISVKDITGKQILSRKIDGTNKVNFNLDNYPVGLYILEISLQTQAIRSRINKIE